MKKNELMSKVSTLITEKNKSMEELERRKSEVESQLDELSEKLKSKEATADFNKFKQTRAEFADAKAYLDLVNKQISEATTPEEKEEAVGLFRELDQQIVAVSEETRKSLKKYADEILEIIERDASLQAQYGSAMDDLRFTFGLNNIVSRSLSFYNVRSYGGTGDVYKGFKRIKSE